MKLKLKQRIALGFYKSKIKAISLVSTKQAAKSLFTFFCTPHNGKSKIKPCVLFKKAKNVAVVYNNFNINGWHFTPQHSNGKKLLVLHGFDSCVYKSEAIISALVNNHFEVFAFDAIAHGTSNGKTINAKIYSECIDLINKKYGTMYALVGHSLGGLAACLAVENYIPHLHKLVLIAPATETTTAINHFFKYLKFPIHLQPLVEDYIKEISGKEAKYFSVSRAIETFNTNTLWIHDTTDFICPIKDVFPVQKKNLPHIEFYFTRKLGHNLVYRNKEVLDKVVTFLNTN